MKNRDDEDKRPDPDILLANFEKENIKAQRGKLKIFFGASAGVGKTYVMLLAAKALAKNYIDIVCGIVETHGRIETAELLQGLELLPLKEVTFQGKIIKEFDLELALTRKPDVIIVDELAHSNMPGLRHLKRWQDIEELLNAGIDVFTTLNVQHLESLNHIIGGVTGINVYETVPDRIFENADEVILVDLTPDELLRRLKEGKIYLPQQTEVAIQNFFRKGNLIALRELALRRSAERVDKEMREYRGDTIQHISPVSDALLVCVGPFDNSEEVVQNGCRLATQLKTNWHVIYVETPKLRNLSEPYQQRILKTLKLARDMGATVNTLTAINLSQAIIEYARKHNLTKIILGRTKEKRFFSYRASLIRSLEKSATDITIVSVAIFSKKREILSPQRNHQTIIEKNYKTILIAYLMAIVGCAITTLLATPLLSFLHLANIVLIFLLPVIAISYCYGKGPAIFSALINVMSFDFFFVQPRFSFSVHDMQYFLTFMIMLLVGMIIAYLTTNFKYQAELSLKKEMIAQDLYQLAQALSAALTEQQIIEISDRFISTNFHLKTAFLLPDNIEQLKLIPKDEEDLTIDMAIATWVFKQGQPAGFGTDSIPGTPLLYLPLKTQMRSRGVFVLEPNKQQFMLVPDTRKLIDTFTTLTAIALERIHFVNVAQSVLIKIETEKLNKAR